MPTGRRRFDRYILDLERGCLFLDGAEITLRPKTFAVLVYLVEHAGRLVPKDEIFDAVWPSLSVTDDTLVQSIGELRRALGESGSRLIRTVPRRGYRLDASVSLVRVDAALEETPASFSAANAANVPQLHAEIAVARANSTSTDAPPSAPMPTAVARGPEKDSLPLAVAGLENGAAGWRQLLGGRRHTALAALALMTLIASGAAVLWNTLDTVRRPLGIPQSTGSWKSNPRMEAKPTVAVLPFADESDDAAREYFADGMTQDIISALGRFSELTVMSWNAVQPYKGKPASPGEIASRLGVSYQVEGHVRRDRDRVRVATQLVGTDGRVIWSGQFEEGPARLFALQDNITTQIAGALAIRVSQTELRRTFAKPAGNLAAYDYALRARPALRRPARENIVEARGLLKRAIELDPTYAAAHASLAETYLIDVSWGWAQSPTDSLSRAENMANTALRLNESEVHARVVLGRIHLYHQRYDRAKAELEQAIASNPSDACGLAGLGNILVWLGQTEVAIDFLEQAQRIDPELNAVDRFALAMAYFLERRYDAASRQAEINLRNSASARSTQALLAAAYAQQNRRADATRIMSLMRRVDPTFDPHAFGNKLQDPADFAHLQDGLRKAGFDAQ